MCSYKVCGNVNMYSKNMVIIKVFICRGWMKVSRNARNALWEIIPMIPQFVVYRLAS